MNRLLLPWTTLIATGDVNAKAFYPATGWVPASKAALIRDGGGGWLRGRREEPRTFFLTRQEYR